jgi:hypothetical protein
MVKLHSYDNMSFVYRTCPAMGKLESSKLLHKRGNESHTVYNTAFPPHPVILIASLKAWHLFLEGKAIAGGSIWLLIRRAPPGPQTGTGQ